MMNSKPRSRILIRDLLRGSRLSEWSQQKGQQVQSWPLFLKPECHQSLGQEWRNPGQDGGLSWHYLEDKKDLLLIIWLSSDQSWQSCTHARARARTDWLNPLKFCSYTSGLSQLPGSWGPQVHPEVFKAQTVAGLKWSTSLSDTRQCYWSGKVIFRKKDLHLHTPLWEHPWVAHVLLFN